MQHNTLITQAVISGKLNPDEYEQVTRAHGLLELHVRDPAVLQATSDLLDLLLEWQADVPLLLVALLLPLTGDDLLEVIEQDFDAQVYACVVEIRRILKQQEPTALLRELYRAAYVNRDALTVIMAQRLVSLAQLDDMLVDDRCEWAQVNFDVYLPVLRLLGLTSYVEALGNISLRAYDRDRYIELDAQIDHYYEEHSRLFHALLARLKPLLGDKAAIKPHEWTPLDLFLEETPTPHFVVDVLTMTLEQVYAVLGVIHGLWKPLRMPQDYVAAPMPTGYRALITTVRFTELKPAATVEFRLRSRAMESVNTHGIIAARMRRIKVSAAWWERVPTDDTNRIGVLAPDGRLIYPLRPGSTVIDVAFRVHSQLGPHARRFWVNGKLVNIDRPVQWFDLVRIDFDRRSVYLKPEWEEHAHTRTARNAIRRLLRNQPVHEGLRRIERVLERESKIYRLRMTTATMGRPIESVARKLGYESTEALYVEVARGKLSPDEVVMAIIEKELAGHISLASGEFWPENRIRIAQTWMLEKGDRKWDRSLRVVPGEPIVGRINRQHDPPTLTVYRAGTQHAPNGETAIPLVWRAASHRQEVVDLTITAPPQAGVVSHVLSCVDGQPGLLLHRCESQMQTHALTLSITLEAESIEVIQKVTETLQGYKLNAIINDFRLWQVLPGQKKLIAGKSDRRQQNPFTLRQIRDQGMFFGREDEIDRIVDCLKADDTFIVLYGQKRIGKTSLMHHLAQNVLPDACDVLPVFFDAHGISPFNPTTFLLGLAEAAHPILLEALPRSADRRDLRLREYDIKRDPFRAFADWVRWVESRLGSRKLLFMIDEFTRAEEEHRRGTLDSSFFDNLQWLAGHESVGFFICVHDHIFREGAQSYGLLQRGQPIHLGELDRVATARLIQQPISRIYTFEDGLVDEILDLTNCHPYFVQALCLELIMRVSKMSHTHITSEDLQSAITVVMRTGQHYFSHFQGQADEKMLDILKVIAYLSHESDPWVERRVIREAMDTFGYSGEQMKLAHNIGRLYQNGLIEVRHAHGTVKYRIPIRLFQYWLRQRTHPLVQKDLRRED